MNKLPKIITIVLVSLVLIFSIFLISFSTPTAFAQAVGCAITKVGNPQGSIPPFPTDCVFTGGAGAGAPAGTWPFVEKSPSQYRRVDQGWDLQENKITDPAAGKTWIYAIAPGTVHHITDACPSCNGGDFGPWYPYVDLDKPFTFKGEYHISYYYGHTHMIDALERKHVNTGDKVAWVDQNAVGNGGPYWMEAGWSIHNSPEAPLHLCCPTVQGQNMKDWLLGQ